MWPLEYVYVSHSLAVVVMQEWKKSGTWTYSRRWYIHLRCTYNLSAVFFLRSGVCIAVTHISVKSRGILLAQDSVSGGLRLLQQRDRYKGASLDIFRFSLVLDFYVISIAFKSLFLWSANQTSKNIWQKYLFKYYLEIHLGYCSRESEDLRRISEL